MTSLSNVGGNKASKLPPNQDSNAINANQNVSLGISKNFHPLEQRFVLALYVRFKYLLGHGLGKLFNNIKELATIMTLAIFAMMTQMPPVSLILFRYHMAV